MRVPKSEIDRVVDIKKCMKEKKVWQRSDRKREKKINTFIKILGLQYTSKHRKERKYNV